jgi:hypothetical protein
VIQIIWASRQNAIALCGTFLALPSKDEAIFAAKRVGSSNETSV